MYIIDIYRNRYLYSLYNFKHCLVIYWIRDTNDIGMCCVLNAMVMDQMTVVEKSTYLKHNRPTNSCQSKSIVDQLDLLIRRVGSRDFFLISDFCYKSPFASKCSWKKRNSHQGKNEVTCIVSKPVVSYLWGWGVCKSSQIKHPGGSWDFVL